MIEALVWIILTFICMVIEVLTSDGAGRRKMTREEKENEELLDQFLLWNEWNNNQK